METEGMSFAQLREVHIMAGQAAFHAGRNLVVDDLEKAAWTLRRTLLFGSLKTESTGFGKLA